MDKLSSFKVETATLEDIDHLVHFFKKMLEADITFLPQEKSDIINKYRKYEDNSQLLNIFLLKDANKNIVGCSGYIPFKGVLGCQSVNGFLGADAIIEPGIRRQFPTLAAVLAHSYQGLVTKEKLFPLLCPVNKEIAKSFRNAHWSEFSYIYKYVSNFAARMIPKIDSTNIEFKNIQHFDEKFKHFFEAIKHEHQFLLTADINFLNWKYLSNPYAKYVALAALKNKKILGYIILEKKYDDIHIVDITVDLKYSSTILLLIFKSLDYLEIGPLDPIVCYLSHRKYMEIFKRAGFLLQWQIECLFFKFALVVSKIKPEDFYSLNNGLFHFNGFTQDLH